MKSDSSTTRLSWLPRSLKRRLTSKRAGSSDPTPRTELGLFAQLPFELREMIYMHALVREKVYIASEIKGVNQNQTLGWNYSTAWQSRERPFRYLCLANPLPLPLLQTCRRIYEEASIVLYSKNTFHILGIADKPPFYHFHHGVSEHHLAMITSICIDTRIDGFPELRRVVTYRSTHEDIINLKVWEQTWDFLATRMPGLRELEVRMINAHFPPLEIGIDQHWVKPMLAVHGMERFEFDIAQHLGSEQSTAIYNEKLDRLQEELKTIMCSPKVLE